MKLEILILDSDYSDQKVPIKEEFRVVYDWQNLSINERQNALLISGEEAKIQEANNHEIADLGLETVKKDTFLPCTYIIEDLFSLTKQEAERIYAREKNIPVVVMETDRMIIREMSEKDIDLLYLLYEDAENTHYVEPLFSNREEEIAYINDYSRMIYRFYDLGMWLLFHKETGTHFSTYIREHRITKAKELLIGTQMKIYEIADQVGYADAKYFSRVFKESTGQLPADYRRTNK